MSVKVVSFDSGHSMFKGAMWDGNEVYRYSFQAIAEKCVSLEQAKELKHKIKVGNQWWGVQESGRLIDAGRTIEPETKIFHGKEKQIVQMCWALEQLKAFNLDSPIPLVIVSLPYKDARDKDLVDLIISQKQLEWSVLDENGNEIKRKQNIAKKGIYAQGNGALRLFQFFTNINPKRATMIDIGSITLDVVSVRRFKSNDSFEYNNGASGSVRENTGGYYLLNKLWAPKIRQTAGLTQFRESYFDLSDRIEDGDFSVTIAHGEKKDLRPSYNESRNQFTRDIQKQSKFIVKNEWDYSDVFILSGGISKALDFTVWDCKGRTYLTDEWANCLGQLMAFLSDEEREKVMKQIKDLVTIKFLTESGEIQEFSRS